MRTLAVIAPLLTPARSFCVKSIRRYCSARARLTPVIIGPSFESILELVEPALPEGRKEFQPIEQGRQSFRHHPVIRLPSVAAVTHETRELETVQMLRHGRLRNAGSGGERVDVEFAFAAQSLEKCAAGGVAQGFEYCSRFDPHLFSLFAGYREET